MSPNLTIFGIIRAIFQWTPTPHGSFWKNKVTINKNQSLNWLSSKRCTFGIILFFLLLLVWRMILHLDFFLLFLRINVSHSLQKIKEKIVVTQPFPRGLTRLIWYNGCITILLLEKTKMIVSPVVNSKQNYFSTLHKMVSDISAIFSNILDTSALTIQTFKDCT